MSKQKIVISIKDEEDGRMGFSFEFDPAIAGHDSEEFKAMSDTEKHHQSLAHHIAAAVVESLKSL